jgi:uncharacterized membrane protein
MRVRTIAACAGVTAGVLVPALLAAAAGTQAAKPYKYVDLSASVPDGSSAYADSINGKGDVSGTVADATFAGQPVIWNKKGQRSALSVPEGIGSAFARGLNARGQTVATGRDANGAYHPLLLQKGHAGQDLGVPPGFDSAFVQGLNDKTQVLANVYSNVDGSQHPAIWTEGSGGRGRWSVHDTIDGGGAAINRAGHVVGYLQPAEQGAPQPAFLLKGKKLTRIDPPRDFTGVYAADVNDSDQIVGSVFAVSETEQLSLPFFWQNGKFTSLPIPEGVSDATAFAINNKSQIVGHAHGEAGHVALLWQKKGKKWRAVILHTQVSGAGGRELGDASGINDAGHIAGGTLVGETHTAFRLDPR